EPYNFLLRFVYRQTPDLFLPFPPAQLPLPDSRSSSIPHGKRYVLPPGEAGSAAPSAHSLSAHAAPPPRRGVLHNLETHTCRPAAPFQVFAAAPYDPRPE